MCRYSPWLALKADVPIIPDVVRLLEHWSYPLLMFLSMSSLFLSEKYKSRWKLKRTVSLKGFKTFMNLSLRYLRHRIAVLVAAIFFRALRFSSFYFGGEFVPELDERRFCYKLTIRQGSSLPQSIVVATQLENILMKNFPEVTETVSKIGSSEIPTDPMPIESGDLIILLKIKKNGRLLRIRKI